ncbi:hypothetical protein GALL_451280 [mine drainage metagenome]|uniref:Uncharacterized protein n=1 Tax=mine drainage metagenome TaxID=410659 RepID=A0A1J5QB91_9ZZZZ
MSHPDNMQRTISAMRPRFIAALAERLVTIRSARAEIAESGPLQRSLLNIQSVAHKTTGVAATLGFEALGKLTARVDVGIEAFLKTPNDTTLHDTLNAAMDQMIAAMMEITAEGETRQTDA